MTGRVPPDRWTCPDCGHTEAFNIQDLGLLRGAIRRAQVVHAGRAHTPKSPAGQPG